MTNYEMVEMLRSKANVTYEEAKAALEASNWDILDAMVLLEREGKVVNEGGEYTTAREKTEDERKKSERHWRSNDDFKSGAKRFGNWLRRVINIGNQNSFVVTRHGEEIIALPVTAFALILAFTFYVTLWVLAIGLFVGFRYSFRGPNLGQEKINNTINKASEMIDNFKAEVIHNDKEEK